VPKNRGLKIFSRMSKAWRLRGRVATAHQAGLFQPLMRTMPAAQKNGGVDISRLHRISNGV